MDSGLASSSTSSLRTHRCTSSVPMDLCTFRFHRWSWTLSSPTEGSSSFSQSLPSSSVTWVVWLEHLPVKTEVKKVVEYLSLLHIPRGNQVSHFLLERAHIFPSHPFITDILIEASLVALHILGFVLSYNTHRCTTYSTSRNLVSRVLRLTTVSSR